MHALRIGDEWPIGQLPSTLRFALDAERFHLHNVALFQNTTRDPQFDKRFLPQNCAAMRIPCFWVRTRRAYVLRASTAAADFEAVFGNRNGHDVVLFPVHPMEKDAHREFLECVGAERAEDVWLWGVPTSSLRTLLAWPDGDPAAAVFIKTSLKSPVFGNRRITRAKAALAVGMTQVVSALPDLPKDLKYLFEPIAVVSRAPTHSGVVFRTIPTEVRAGSKTIIPLFSLFGGRDQSRRPLLLQIAERQRISPLELVEVVLCERFAILWVQLALRFGMYIEAHGQDLLLELTADLKSVGAFVYRDFEGLVIDWELHRALGFPAHDRLPNAFAFHATYQTWGFPYCQLIWKKVHTSIYDYLYLVIKDLDEAMVAWQAEGEHVSAVRLRPGDLMMMFSRHLLSALAAEEREPPGEPYDVLQNLDRFVRAMLAARKRRIGCSVFKPRGVM